MAPTADRAMVNDLEQEISVQCSSPSQDHYITIHINTLRKGMNLSLLLLQKCAKQQDRPGHCTAGPA